MDFGNRAKSRSKKNDTSVIINDRYPHKIQLYTVPPAETISLQEFEELAVERLKGTGICL